MNGRFALLLVILCAPARTALAEDSASSHPWLDKTFILEFGIFYPDRSVKLKAEGSASIGLNPRPYQSIDFGSQFSISETDDLFAAELGWRYREKWSFRMQYFNSEGSNTALLEEDIQWEDLTFLAGTNARAGAQFQLTRFVWDYEILDRPYDRAGFSFGFHWLHIGGFIEGTVLTPDGTGTAYESASVDAPLPNIGFTYARALSSRWGFRTRLDWFSADIHPYDGIFVNASAGFNYRLTESLGIGFNYNFIELDVGVDGDNWRGEVANRHDGLYLYLDAVW